MKYSEGDEVTVRMTIVEVDRINRATLMPIRATIVEGQRGVWLEENQIVSHTPKAPELKVGQLVGTSHRWATQWRIVEFKRDGAILWDEKGGEAMWAHRDNIHPWVER